VVNRVSGHRFGRSREEEQHSKWCPGGNPDKADKFLFVTDPFKPFRKENKKDKGQN
jgi:hypothetical protein